MSRKLLWVLAAFVALTGCRHHTSWQNLQDWVAKGNAHWQTSAGITQTSSPSQGSFLVSPQPWVNYQLEVEFKPSAEVNSGIFVACQDPNDITPFTCHEINIWDHHPKQEFRTGAIVAKVFPPFAHLETVDKWNHYSITMKDGAVRVELNGTPTAHLKQSELKQGYIALQKAEAGTIEFRKLRITLID